jgi:hypothetical protein
MNEEIKALIQSMSLPMMGPKSSKRYAVIALKGKISVGIRLVPHTDKDTLCLGLKLRVEGEGEIGFSTYHSEHGGEHRATMLRTRVVTLPCDPTLMKDYMLKSLGYLIDCLWQVLIENEFKVTLAKDSLLDYLSDQLKIGLLPIEAGGKTCLFELEWLVK